MATLDTNTSIDTNETNPSAIPAEKSSSVTFESMPIQADIQKALARADYKNPTPIQAATIPMALAGNDVMGCAQTGTGKTAAFLIPLIMHLEKNPKESGLVLAPTREIAIQICESAKSLLRFNNTVHGCVLIGGSPMSPQIRNLQRGPKLIIGTPGRVFDHMNRGTLSLEKCTFVILDEADQMLDMGFAPQIEQIVNETPEKRQTLMFSATLPPAIVKLSKRYLKNPQMVSVGEREKAVDTLKQKVIITETNNKEALLRDELKNRKGSILIFAQTQWKTDQIAERLQEDGFTALSIHGGLSQNQRFRALHAFKTNQINILVATDVASRGLHIDNIAHVVNFDLPTCSEAFLHRIGRTARNGKDGEAVTLVEETDRASFNRIKVYLKNCEIVGEFSRKQFASRPFGRGNRGARPSGGRDFAPRSKFSSQPFGERRTRDFGSDRPSDNRPQMNSDRPKFNSDRPQFNSDRPQFNGERPKFGGDRPKFNSDRPQFNSDRPKFGSERPKFNSERPQFNSDRPKFGGDRPKFVSDRPQFNSDRPKFANDRPKFANDRPKFGGDRPKFANDRPKFNKERTEPSSAKPRFSKGPKNSNVSAPAYAE